MSKNAESTRDKIKTSVMELVVQKGSGTTIKDIAAAADVAEGTLYRHWKSKDMLIEEVFREHYSAFAYDLGEIIRKAPNAAAKIDALVDHFCSYYDTDPLRFRFLMLVQHDTLPGIENNGANPIEVLQHLIVAAIKAGDIEATDPALTTVMILGLILQPATGITYGRVSGTMSNVAPAIKKAIHQAFRLKTTR